MQNYRRGLAIEERIKWLLEYAGFTVQRDVSLDHENKVDLVIMAYPKNLRYSSVGVQVKTSLDDSHAQREFLEANQSETNIPKYLYLEIAYEVDLDAGGGVLVI